MKSCLSLLIAFGFISTYLPASAESSTDYIYFCSKKADNSKCKDIESSLNFNDDKINAIRDEYGVDITRRADFKQWYTIPVYRLESHEAGGRNGIFAVESGPHWARKWLILPNEDAAKQFCSKLVEAGIPYPKGHNLAGQQPTLDNSVLYSKVKGSPATNRVIAVGYRIQPSNNLRYHFCPNPWDWKPIER